MALLACLLGIAGCSFSGVYEVPLPGGADVGAHPYRVRAEFHDVLDLVPQSEVKVKDVTVGAVERIELSGDGRIAEVTLLVNGSVRLPANAVARLRQSSVLGEKFVELDGPSAEPAGRLADGAVIPVARTNRNPEIEEVFGALSMLLNGGGVGQLQQITMELNDALAGNEDAVHSLLSNMDTFVGGLDAHRHEITRALEGLNRLAGQFGARRDEIANLLENLGGGIEVLADQREEFVAMLTSLDSLSDVAVDTIEASKEDLLADLRALEPILRQLNVAGQKLPQAMEMLFTMPFSDAVLDAVKGDYLNLYLSMDTNAGGAPQGMAPLLPLPVVDQAAPGGER